MIALALAAALGAASTDDCVVIGDSLALGIGTMVNAHVRGAQCRIAARKGDPSTEILRKARPVVADVAVVSAGANDPADPALPSNLYYIRRSIRARQVIWVIPRDPRAAGAVRQACRSWRDVGVDLARYPSRADGVHPQDYWTVARAAFRSTSCE
jgi:hypothetical protein